MKIQILEANATGIQGYEQVRIDGNKIDLSTYSDNECEFILASEVFDSFLATDVNGLVKYLASKLRLGGTLIVGGTDINLFCKSVMNAQTSEADAAALISSKKSMTTPQMAISALINAGLQIQATQVNGLHYECTASR